MKHRERLVPALFALGILSLPGCHDPCFLVLGCRDSHRVAVEGRIVTSESGAPIAGTALTLIVRTADRVDSALGVSDQEGLFALAVPLDRPSADSISLRVRPVGRRGYIIAPLDCSPVSGWGEACVLSPIVPDPRFPRFRFLRRNDVERAVSNARVVFKRTGGGRLTGPNAADSVVAFTDAMGFADLFGPGIFPDSLGAIIGELRVDLPAPVGTTVRQNYRIAANPRFNMPLTTVQPVGPTLEYLMVFTDSITQRRVAGVEMRFVRQSGIATNGDSARFVSNADGLAFLTLRPLAQGTVIGDFAITPPGASATTTLSGVALNTFDADSSIVFARWTVGATGRLYPASPP